MALHYPHYPGRNASASAAPPPVKACNYCHKSHVACDGGRPCGRCVKRGVAGHCCDLVPRKKGRPARNDPRFRPKRTDKTNNHASSHDNHQCNTNTNTNTNTNNSSNIDNINSKARRSGCSATRGASDMEASPLASSRPEASGPWPRPERPHHHMYDQQIDGLPCSDGDDEEDEDDDDDDDDDDEEEERWRRKLYYSRGERAREAEPPPDLASRMIAMMADEIHQLRKENAKLRCKVKQLRKYKRARKEEDTSHSLSHSNHNRGCSAKRPRYDDAPAATERPQPAETRPSSVAWSECAGLSEARKVMPFLNHYRMSADVPFVVGDLHSRPVFVLDLPPVVGGQASWAFFNEPFLSMLQFTKDELRRVSHRAVLAENPKTLERILPLLQGQDGRTVRSTSNIQFFYGPTGIVKYVVSVTLHWEEDTMREGEGFRENLNTPTTVGPLSVLPTAPAHPHHSSPTTGACESYGHDGLRNQATPSALNADYWDQVLQSLAAPAVVHHPTHYP